MLKLIEIKKDYILKEQEPVHALKGLSVNFRRNEFVAILGPSGCGKTTLLNIIGGLDRYTSGDLVIAGKSTKDYKDRDWDTYRNHSIGFVFQSYNLIGHQNILKNVELALTIGGVSRKERKERAIKALEKVGLGGLEKKKPNQLSGGQMQRVAIARALVNEPEIILADEPTGALDSETSIQIMDLLKEVASNCLVIMVTHNPDLADQYATRIVRMKDGELLSDTNPFSDTDETKECETLKTQKEVVKNVENPTEIAPKKNKRSAMSFFTATGLSFSNLVSKLSRTILIAIAGSIGIVGVSAVLAVSFGVKNYVNGMQDDMLSQYPVTVAEESVDLTSLVSGLSNWDEKHIEEFDKAREVGLDSMIQYLMDHYTELVSSQSKTNNITEEFIAYIEQLDDKAISSLKYNYGIDPTNNIFTHYTRDHTKEDAANFDTSLNGLTQMYASELKTVEGFSYFASYINLFTAFMNQLPNNPAFIESQYDVLAGEGYATKADELVVVVDDDQTMTDFLYGQLGFYDETEFLNIAKKAVQDNDPDIKPEDRKEYNYRTHFSFDEILGKEFYYYPNIYSYESFDVLKVNFDLKLSQMFIMMINASDMGIKLTSDTVSYSLEYKEDLDVLDGALYFEGNAIAITLTRDGAMTDPTKPYVGTWITNDSFIKSSASSSASESSINLPTFAYVIDENSAQLTVTDNTPIEYPEGSGNYITPQSMIDMFFSIENFEAKEQTVEGYMYDVNPKATYGEPMKMKIAGILKKKNGINFGSLQTGVYYTPAFTEKFIADQIQNEIYKNANHGIKKHISSGKQDKYAAYVKYRYTSYLRGEDSPEEADDYSMSLNADRTAALSSMISTTMPGMSPNVDINKQYLRAICGYSAKQDNDTKQWSFDKLPKSISIYPKSFNDKDKVTSHIDKWNNANEKITVTINGETREVNNRSEITYTDPVQMIITVINTLILTITIALIAFTSLSLVVSCFMIAVITFISTMERVKEIGVIRSLGGRKKDVSRLFIAECLITGLASGLIGIGVTYILQVVFNLSMLQFNIFNIAALPIWMAAIMVGVSIFLNVMSGLIPSMKASHQDPVVALRTE